LSERLSASLTPFSLHLFAKQDHVQPISFRSFPTQVEDESDNLLDRAQEKFSAPLEAFRKERVGHVRQAARKEFERATQRYCAAADRYARVQCYLRVRFLKCDILLQTCQRELTQGRRTG